RGRRTRRRGLAAPPPRLLPGAAAQPASPDGRGADLTVRAIKKAGVFGFLYSARSVRRALVASPRADKLLRPGFEAVLWRIGKWRVWLLFEDARRHVPAYRAVWQEHGCPEVQLDGLDPDLSAIPITDKES